MTPTLALATAELRSLARNRTAAATAVLLPLGLGLLWTVGEAPVAMSAGAIASLQVIVLLAFTVYGSGTTLIVARREGAVLKRWRASSVSTPGLLTGLILPLIGLLVLQSAILLGATAITMGEGPQHPLLLLFTIVTGGALVGVLALATAGLTHTSEAAMITTLPIVGALIAGGMWVMASGPDDVTPLMLITGGGALVHLVHSAWEGAPGAWVLGITPDALASLAAVALVALGAAVVARATFRWDPRG